MKATVYDWAKLASENKPIVIWFIVAILGGGGLGYGSHSYMNQPESKSAVIPADAKPKALRESPYTFTKKMHKDFHNKR